MAAAFEGSWPSRAQDAELGSYARIHDAHLKAEPMTVSATIWPTLPGRGEQGIVSWLDESGGAVLFLDGERGASVRINTARGVETVAVGQPLRARAWYRVWASVDPRSETVQVGQQAVRPLGMVDDSGTASQPVTALISGGNGGIFIGAIGGSPVGGHFNGKIEGPAIVRGAAGTDEAVSVEEPSETR